MDTGEKAGYFFHVLPGLAAKNTANYQRDESLLRSNT